MILNKDCTELDSTKRIFITSTNDECQQHISLLLQIEMYANAKKLGNALDAPYTVRQNETHGLFGINFSTISNSRFNEILNNASSRTLAINVDEDVKEIQIIGTQIAK